MIGQVVSHYRILEKLGEGGMGVVYKAEDINLRRLVALKTLPSESAADPGARQRLLREARAAAGLNHPNICVVHEIDEHHNLLAMEFVDGQTVAALVKERPLPLNQALTISIQAAEGLRAAHERGVVHRDIKPSNLIVSAHGPVKILDFGLAVADASTRLTLTGSALGTPAYMSPEQARAGTVDRRTDIWSLGVVLYEMVTGSPPFRGETGAAVANAVLNARPEPLTALRSGVPLELDRIVEKALAKDAGERYQHADDLLVDLRALLRRVEGQGPSVASVRLGKRKLIWISAVTVMVAAGVVAWRLTRPEWRDPFLDARFTRLTDFEGTELDTAISRDGKLVAFLSDRDGPFDVWVGQIGSTEYVNLTKGKVPELLHEEMPSVGFTPDGANVWVRDPKPDQVSLFPTLAGQPRGITAGISPTWSPDAKRMVWARADPTHGEPILLAEANGGNPKQIYAQKGVAHCHFVTWSPDGRFLYFTFGLPSIDIARIPSTGATEQERITFHNTRVVYPKLLDDRTLVYIARSEDGAGSWLYSMDLEKRSARRFNSGVEQYISVDASSDGKRIVAAAAKPVSNLWSAPISNRTAGESEVQRFSHPSARALAPRFGNGFILYLSSRGHADGIHKLVEDSATEIWKGSDGVVQTAPSISPDHKRLCYAVSSGGKNRLHVLSVDGTDARPLGESLDVRGTCSWSPDGNWIAVASAEEGAARMYKVPVNGGAHVKLSDVSGYSPNWSPNGKLILYEYGPGGTGRLIRAMTSDGKPYELPQLTTRSGGDRIRFLPGGNTAILLLGEFRRQDFWLFDLQTKSLRRLTQMKTGYTIRGFDVSPGGDTILFDRTRENSDIVLIETAGR